MLGISESKNIKFTGCKQNMILLVARFWGSDSVSQCLKCDTWISIMLLRKNDLFQLFIIKICWDYKVLVRIYHFLYWVLLDRYPAHPPKFTIIRGVQILRIPPLHIWELAWSYNHLVSIIRLSFYWDSISLLKGLLFLVNFVEEISVLFHLLCCLLKPLIIHIFNCSCLLKQIVKIFRNSKNFVREIIPLSLRFNE